MEPQHLFAVRSIAAYNTCISIADVMLLLIPVLHSFTPGMKIFGTVFGSKSPKHLLGMSGIKVYSTGNSGDLIEHPLQSPNCQTFVNPIILKGGGPGNEFIDDSVQVDNDRGVSADETDGSDSAMDELLTKLVPSALVWSGVL